VIGRWTGKNDVFISGLSSGRNEIRLINSIGMFVKTLPLILKRKAGMSVLVYIQYIQSTLNATINHENYPFINIATDYNYFPSIMYACELGILKDFTIDNESVSINTLHTTQPKFKISIHIEERDGEIVFAVQYNDAFYSAELMEQFTETLNVALRNLLSDLERPVSKISLLSEHCALDYYETDSYCLHTLFETAVDRYPNHIALIAEDGTFSYKELNEEANKLANALINHGVEIEDHIALILKRTSRVIIAMLGVMKAGGVYIPLDPDNPAERINQIISVANARFILTDSYDLNT
jgi:non-ribosomal peptide synthetase component F